MSEEFDINKVVTEFITEFVKQNLGSAYNSGKGMLKGATDEVRLHLSNSYKEYLKYAAEKYAKGKSFFIRHEPTYLYDLYVPVGVTCQRKVIERASIREMSFATPYIIITGGAGSGKSMLMRHLFLDALTSKSRVPVFIELREINQTNQLLPEFIYDTLTSYRFKLDKDYFEKALKAGHFAFFFDGLDEISLSLRKQIGKQIQKFTKSYDNNLIVISSRQDEELSSWPLFNVCQINPLTLDQACDLVERLPFDSDMKSKFLTDLRIALFKRHKSFLSNPLLLSIMVLTYGEYAQIPNKLSVFYNQAYEALFQRHDALKGGFQRERRSALDIQDFASVFCAFCVQTYDGRITQFSRSDALQILDRAKKIVGIEFNTTDYLLDALQAVCLLVEDGLLLNFPHRSFQEYFTARFICESRPEVQSKLISKYARNIDIDNVMNLLYEMAPSLVEREFILPGINNMIRILGIKKKIGITHFLKYLKSEFKAFEFHDRRGFGIHHNNGHGFHKLIRFVLRHCGHLTNEAMDMGRYTFGEVIITKYHGGIEFQINKLTATAVFT